MRVLAFLFLSAYLLPINCFAQTGGHGQGVPSQPAQQFHYEDGGTTEVLQSIFIPPKMQAPFSITLETEWVKSLSDGGTITLVNRRHISRDSRGRISQERCTLVPKSGKFESHCYLLQIADPHTHAVYNCFLDSRHECVKLEYDASTSGEYKSIAPPSGELPNGMGRAEHEQLGKQTIEGTETVGTRERVIYNPGVFGNDQIMTIEREYWYSPQLGINLLSIRSDPRIGKQTFRATEIVQSEPDPSLFKLPPGFKVVSPTHPEQPEQVDQ